MASPEQLQTLNAGLQVARDYADTVVKGPLSQLGGILSDTIGHWRLKNQVRLILKTKSWLENKGIEPKPLLPDIFVPLLEDGANVGDETLADMFASLLQCHLDPSHRESVHPSYTKVLSQLSPFDAKAMLEFRKWISHTMAREVGLRGAALTVEMIMADLALSSREAYLSCLNLARLGIVEHIGYRSPQKHPIPTVFKDSPEHQEFRMTEYGASFCDACHDSDEPSQIGSQPRQKRAQNPPKRKSPKA